MKAHKARIIAVYVVFAIVCGGCGGSGSSDGTDIGVDVVATPDLASPDLIAEVRAEDTFDAGPPDVKNQARLFPNNPKKDGWKKTTVTLTNIDDPDGALSGPFANVFNCLNEDGGWVKEYDVLMFGKVKAQLCNIKKTVMPGEDGSYLHVKLPDLLSDPGDMFAELMMFYHVNVIHDYYKSVHGYDGMDVPLEAYVNLQAYIETDIEIDGIPQGWVTFDNAMFIPGESFEELEKMGEELLKAYLGIDDDLALPFKNDAIFFLQGEELDFAYDADVIYHEYTHATVGGDRLFGYSIDEYGPDAAPTGINEAYADYFACTVTGDPLASEYALGTLSGNEGRDISIFHKCPDDYYGEEHQDGRLYSNALWQIRELLGQEDADLIIFNALLTFGQTTDFKEAALATIAEAALLEPPRDAEVSAIFEEHGALGCNNRIREYHDTKGTEEFPTFVAGTQVTGVPGYSKGAPGFVQYTIEVPEGALKGRLEASIEGGGTMSILGSFLGVADEIYVSMAFKHDGPVTHSYEPKYSHSADALVTMVQNEEGLFVAEFGGNCLEPGVHHFQFINHSMDTVVIRDMVLTWDMEEPVAQANYDCYEVDPCDTVFCDKACEQDNECESGETCVVYAQGCCSQCQPQCELCYAQAGEYCMGEKPDEACEDGTVTLTEAGVCWFELTYEGLDGTDTILVNGCTDWVENLPVNGCSAQFTAETNLIEVSCNWCGPVPYSHDDCDID